MIAWVVAREEVGGNDEEDVLEECITGFAGG